MLEILSETKDPTRCQPHLKKCFEGINTLDFDDNYVIHAMNSVENERVPYKHAIDTSKVSAPADGIFEEGYFLVFPMRLELLILVNVVL